MSRFRLASVAALMLAALGGGAPAQDKTEALKAEAADLTRRYAAKLTAALQDALQKSGPLGAVEVCHDAAPKIAAELSAQSGWTLGRTSLKPRNAASAPDAYERAAMEAFEAEIAKGESAAKLARAEIVDGKTFRFVKAIPTSELCVTCHGAAIAPELKRKIDALYPGDRATGFKPGDMRGAFTLKKPLG